MGFFSNTLSATVKTALTPLAIVKDAIDDLGNAGHKHCLICLAQNFTAPQER